MEAGLDLLKRKAPQWYNYVLGGTRKIKQLPAGAGARMDPNRTHSTAWGYDDYPNALNIYTIAHEMIHEACHGYQSVHGSHPEAWQDELECVEKELAAALVFDPHDTYGRHSQWRQTIANIRDPSTWWWD